MNKHDMIQEATKHIQEQCVSYIDICVLESPIKRQGCQSHIGGDILDGEDDKGEEDGQRGLQLDL